MNVRLLTLLTSAATMTMAGAFTIDFNTLQVSDGVTTSSFTMPDVTSGSPQTVTVPGYGDVLFQVGPGPDVITVDSNYSNDGGTTFQQSLEVGASEFIVVTFLAADALNVDFDIIGVSTGEESAPSNSAANEFQYSPGNGGPADGAGIAAISWTVVPEPSSSLMVMLGAGSMLLRRRR